ncbi:hypothetical protein AB4G91_07270 [Macrococcoides goetzii]|uniref:hypothetical protein n=1 Tax=Macrococcus TaxID=69965 RepID=UPI001EF389D6|nr:MULTISPECIES: hypothetical protein [Macrococcus]MCG7419489.1 hypothetical protein [Macrococcus epidermidis]MCH4984832.1 hypothetical protein [Macrococcus sp. PK]
MEKVILLNILITCTLFLYFYKKELKPSYIPLIFSSLLVTLINYPVIGTSNFISKTVVLFVMVTSIVHIYLRYYHYEHYHIYIHNRFIHLIFAIIFNISIPFILITSPQSIYQSSAYLSVSVFILGLILYQLSEIDRPVRWFQIERINTYRYIKHPKQLGEIFFVISYCLLTLFLPYSFFYVIIGITYIFYIKKNHLFKET